MGADVTALDMCLLMELFGPRSPILTAGQDQEHRLAIALDGLQAPDAGLQVGLLRRRFTVDSALGIAGPWNHSDQLILGIRQLSTLVVNAVGDGITRLGLVTVSAGREGRIFAGVS